MSDQKLRDLERRWKETGSPDDEAAYLLERVRVGDLSRERLELAAYCGREAVAHIVPDAIVGPVDLAAFARGLAQWGKPAAIAFALACGRRALHAWKAAHPEDASFDPIVAVSENWLTDPNDDLARRAKQLAEGEPAVSARKGARGPDERRMGPDVRAAGAIYRLGMAVAEEDAKQSAGHAAVCAWLSAEAVEQRQLQGEIVSESLRSDALAALMRWVLSAHCPPGKGTP